MKGNIYTSINPNLQLWKELNSNLNTISYEKTKENLITSNSPINSDSDRNIDYFTANTTEDLKIEDKLNQINKLYQVENFKKIYAYKETLKMISPYNLDKYKKINFIGNEKKINNMVNPYKHLEYSPTSKSYNLIRDNFKKHVEEVLKYKHLERGENKKLKK